MKRLSAWMTLLLLPTSLLAAEESALPTVVHPLPPQPVMVPMAYPVVYYLPRGELRIVRPDIVVGSTVIQRPDIVLSRPSLLLPGQEMMPPPAAAFSPPSPPPPVATPAPATTFSVHLGSFLEPEQAGVTGQHLGEMNYPHFQKSLTVNGKRFLRVYAGPFATKNEAEEARQHLEGAMKIEGITVPTPGEGELAGP